MESTPNRLSYLVNKLRQHGCRMTPQRLAILEAVLSNDSHPTVEQVYEKVRDRFPMTSLATVYKTIALLKEVGEIRELSFGTGSNRYDALNPEPHPHLICIRCHKIIDPDIRIFEDLPGELTNRYGYRITQQRVDFYGLCPDCQRGSSAAQSRSFSEIT